LRTYDLGEGGLVPIRLTQPDGKTLVSGGQYYILSFGSHKNAFSPKHSLTVRPAIGSKGPNHIWSVDADIRDDLLAVTKVALQSPDLWTDPNLPRIVFVSGRLHAALQKANLAEAFRLFSCRVVED
jgi:hypothetical protein